MALSKQIIAIALAAGLSGFVAGYYGNGRKEDAGPTAQPHSPDRAAGPLATTEYYMCPMHPEIVSHDPGNCPICGMELVKKTGLHGAAHNHDHDTLPAVNLSSSVVHNLGIRTAQAEIGELQRHIETIGKITRVDQSAKRIITPPLNGQLSYIADKYEGDEVAQGELLFSVTSPELFEMQRRYQESASAGDQDSASELFAELGRQGLSPEQLALLQAGVPPQLPVEVYAQEDGFIFARRGRTGESVRTGFTVFNLGGSYRLVEVTAEIFERQWGWVEEGQPARMSVRGLPGVYFEGQVVRVEPPVGYTTRSLEVLLKFKTDHRGLSQSMFAHVEILGKARRNVLMVPADSVIRTGGGDRIVVVRPDGLYQPVPVVAGEESAGSVEIRSGLAEGATVVASGQFLIDSESNLQAEWRRMTPPFPQQDAN